MSVYLGTMATNYEFIRICNIHIKLFLPIEIKTTEGVSVGGNTLFNHGDLCLD
jgi:FAD/FMN-containing dehydrogenase